MRYTFTINRHIPSKKPHWGRLPCVVVEAESLEAGLDKLKPHLRPNETIFSWCEGELDINTSNIKDPDALVDADPNAAADLPSFIP